MNMGNAIMDLCVLRLSQLPHNNLFVGFLPLKRSKLLLEVGSRGLEDNLPATVSVIAVAFLGIVKVLKIGNIKVVRRFDALSCIHYGHPDFWGSWAPVCLDSISK